MKTSFKNINYTDIKQNNTGSSNAFVTILPWGSIEPHGEHLPYLTDSILAEEVAHAVASEANQKVHVYVDNIQGHQSINFVVLPSVWCGSQNPTQGEYPFCIHFNMETQKAILDDIVTALKRQGRRVLYIINGHNGNAFKGIVRDVENKHKDFTIYVCNYLDLASDYLATMGIPKSDVDDHAAFTETSLMLYIHPELVQLENIKEEDNQETYPDLDNSLWTPRNWKACSVNTRVGSTKGASAEMGAAMFGYVVETLSSNIAKKHTR